MESASSSSSSSSHGELVDGTIKVLVCIAGCEDTVNALGAACFPDSDGDSPATTPPPNAEACTRAVAALLSCMLATADVYESYVRDMGKQEEAS